MYEKTILFISTYKWHIIIGLAILIIAILIYNYYTPHDEIPVGQTSTVYKKGGKYYSVDQKTGVISEVSETTYKNAKATKTKI